MKTHTLVLGSGSFAMSFEPWARNERAVLKAASTDTMTPPVPEQARELTLELLARASACVHVRTIVLADAGEELDLTVRAGVDVRPAVGLVLTSAVNVDEREYLRFKGRMAALELELQRSNYSRRGIVLVDAGLRGSAGREFARSNLGADCAFVTPSAHGGLTLADATLITGMVGLNYPPPRGGIDFPQNAYDEHEEEEPF